MYLFTTYYTFRPFCWNKLVNLTQMDGMDSKNTTAPVNTNWSSGKCWHVHIKQSGLDWDNLIWNLKQWLISISLSSCKSSSLSKIKLQSSMLSLGQISYEPMDLDDAAVCLSYQNSSSFCCGHPSAKKMLQATKTSRQQKAQINHPTFIIPRFIDAPSLVSYPSPIHLYIPSFIHSFLPSFLHSIHHRGSCTFANNFKCPLDLLVKKHL